MHLIKSDVRYYKYSIKKPNLLDNFYYEIQNTIDVLDINNDLYYFLHNHFLNSKKKWLFLYIIFNIENLFSAIINFIQIISNKKKKILPIFLVGFYIKKKSGYKSI